MKQASTGVRVAKRVARTETDVALAHYMKLFDFAPVGYVVLDAAGAIRQGNLEAARILGMPQAQLLGTTLASFFETSQRATVSRFVGRVAAAGKEPSRHVCEATLPMPEGDPLEVRLSAAALSRTEATVTVLVAIVDTTTMKRAEPVREENRLKDELLDTLSHELRNPLGPILSSASLLARIEPLGEAARTATATIERQVKHLARIVDGLLDVSRIARGKIELQRERLELRDVVRQTADDHRPLFESAGIAFEVAVGDEPLWVDADPTRAVQVVGNLLANALKFTHRAGHVVIRLRGDSGFAELSVRDDGIGIAPEMRDRLFRPFVQAPQGLARTRGGLGLGLAMVRGLVALHGGTVHVASEGPRLGSEFVVRLPCARAPSALPAGPSTPTSQPARRRVLLIDDSVESLIPLQGLLELDGHEVRLAHDGASGLAMARSFRPEFVLCDIGLPDIDGYEVARTIRGDALLREASVVALSGYAAPEHQRLAEEAGFDAHLAKPPDLELIARLVAEPPRSPGERD